MNLPDTANKLGHYAKMYLKKQLLEIWINLQNTA